MRERVNSAINKITEEIKNNGGSIRQGRLADIILESELTTGEAKEVLESMGFTNPGLWRYIFKIIIQNQIRKKF